MQRKVNQFSWFEPKSEAAARLGKLSESVGNLSEVFWLNPQELIKQIDFVDSGYTFQVEPTCIEVRLVDYSFFFSSMFVIH